MPGVKGRSGGRNAKTVSQHVLEGTLRGDRHAGFQNPEPPKGPPRPPKRLKGEAKREWTRMIQRLTESKVLAKVDDGALYQYVRLFAETEKLAADQAHTTSLVEELEETMHNLKGVDRVTCITEIVKLKQLEARYSTMIRQGRMSQRIYLIEFGLTPASRSRVKLPDLPGTPDPLDPFTEFDEKTSTH